ncbi:MAG: hypothetical protein PHF18_11525 [Methanosarcina sp.]|uniref:hypothetical protein n=1 Tax=Methanosarcina sp. TaxID=2213 RepID=UPI002627357E|nr:hypothetical protein [Methanosarcina sp.]MDD3247460.1 hypothetical protein [Methanosarcina sp.]
MLNSKSLAKVLGLIYLILALIFSPFILLMMSAEGALGLTESIIIIIVVILFYGIAGAIGGFLIGVIYNFVAKKVGGIEMEIETA